GTSDVVRASLAGETARALLQDAAAALRARPEELLLAGFARALAQTFERDELDIEVESHGREPLFDDVDVSRTVGWFPAQIPLRLRTSPDRAADVRHVKETLRGLPRGGLGHGLLRWLAARPLGGAPPEIGFNYFGRLDRRAPEGLAAFGAREALHGLRAPGS